MSSNPIPLQFFVRSFGGNTLVLQAWSNDNVDSIHHKIYIIIGIPITEQRLIYGKKQLKPEQTLAECNIENDSELHLMGRLRSTSHAQAYYLTTYLISLIKTPGPGFSSRIKSALTEYLEITPPHYTNRAAGHLQVFLSSGAAAALVNLYTSPVYRDAADESIRRFLDSCKSVLPKATYMLCKPIALGFCELLSKAAGADDPLYGFCKSSLESIEECITIARLEQAMLMLGKKFDPNTAPRKRLMKKLGKKQSIGKGVHELKA